MNWWEAAVGLDRGGPRAGTAHAFLFVSQTNEGKLHSLGFFCCWAGNEEGEALCAAEGDLELAQQMFHGDLG